MDIPEGSYVGYLAGVTTALLWTATSLFFAAALKRISVTWVNSSRMLFAVAMLAVTHRLYFGVWLPNVNVQQVWYLAVSGVLGLTIGDQALLTAFGDIGPRRALLVMTLAPLLAALFGRAGLEERLPWLSWAGIVMTVGGVGWVILERRPDERGGRDEGRVRGPLLALLAAACQAIGLMLSKKGMGHGWLPADQHLDPQAASLVRMAFGAMGMLPIVALYALRENLRGAVTAAPGPKTALAVGLLLAFGGAVVGPYLGVWMSLVASDRVPIGVAQTLSSLTPIFILPFAAILHEERIGRRAVLGAFAAVGGCVLLFMAPM